MVASLGRVLEGQPGRRDPLLLHRELHVHRDLSDRRGGDDPAAHGAQGHLHLQRSTDSGRGARGVGLEASTWRRIPTAFLFPDAARRPGRLITILVLS